MLLYKRFARTAERLLADEKQPLLFDEQAKQPAGAQAPAAPRERQKVKAYERRKPGRKKLSEGLPRKIETIDIPEEEKTCACGARLVKIGQETSEKLEIMPPSLYVTRTVRPKYACRHCEGTAEEGRGAVRIAPPPLEIIPRSIASASLLSYIMIQKYQDHLPYYRQEIQFERIGAEVSRQDMAAWQQKVYEKLEPLFPLMTAALKSGPIMQMDETTAQVMGEPGRQDTQKSYMWLALGGLPGKRVAWYGYYPTRSHEYPKALLEGYSGFLQADGFEAYPKAIAGMEGIKLVGCFAHVRRRFFEALKAAKDPQLAEEGVNFIRVLYDIEGELRGEDLKPSEFMAKRKKEAGPVLAMFRLWLDKQAAEVPPSFLLGRAVAYALNQWDKLVMYLESPCLTPDNNAAENCIRPFVIGRKGWMFNKSPEGAKSSFAMFSLIETAKQNGIEPFRYLYKLFMECPFASTDNDWERLLPWNIFEKKD